MTPRSVGLQAQRLATFMIMTKHAHSWTYDEGYTDDDGYYSGDGELYCQFCFHWRTNKKNADGSERCGDYIPEEDEPECHGYRS